MGGSNSSVENSKADQGCVTTTPHFLQRFLQVHIFAVAVGKSLGAKISNELRPRLQLLSLLLVHCNQCLQVLEYPPQPLLLHGSTFNTHTSTYCTVIYPHTFFGCFASEGKRAFAFAAPCLSPSGDEPNRYHCVSRTKVMEHSEQARLRIPLLDLRLGLESRIRQVRKTPGL